MEKNLEVVRCLKHVIDATEDLENRSRQNNIRIRGLPESVGTEELKVTLQGIFNSLLKRPKTADLEIDRAHRTQGPRDRDTRTPRDVICRIHFFYIKESIMVAAWATTEH